MKQLTIDGIIYNLVPAEEPKTASPFHIPDEQMQWSDAMTFAEEKGMRLLRSEELHVLVRDGHLPVKTGWAWASSSVSNLTSYAWLVSLGIGNTTNYDKTSAYRVVCVPKDFDLAAYLERKV
jgi:hypothetical protein